MNRSILRAALIIGATIAALTLSLLTNAADAATTRGHSGRAVQRQATRQVGVTAVYRFSSSPIAPSGRLSANARTTVTLTAQNGSSRGIGGARVYLSLKPTRGGGSARVGGTVLTSKPTLFTMGAAGALQVVYATPPKMSSLGQDTIVAQDLASSPAYVNADSYSFNAGTPTISIGDSTVVEGDQHPSIPATFTVTLSSVQATPVTVKYTTVCGPTPCGGDDFASITKPVTVTVPAGKSSTTIVVPQYSYVGAHGLETYNESWFVQLANPGGAVLGRSIGNGLLLPDVEAGRAVIADLYVGGVGVIRSTGSSIPMYVIVTLGAVEPGPVTFHYATANGLAVAGVDYAAVGGTGTIPAGKTSLAIIIQALAGPLGAIRSFTLNISNPTGGPLIGRATGTQTIMSG